ncbi:MAG: menaquinone biosynthesis protein [Deltaproteobacteria bacterium]|nr:menaquinone biosynthesis protein [Deltaproteobacteria bacterium]
MDQSRQIIPRLGRTDYLNTRPVFYGFDKGVVKETFTTTRGEPSYLNHLLAEGKLDISLISSAAYAFESEKYLILPDLSVSSFGPVDSVLLLSKVPFEKLDEKLIVLTESSATSIQLIKLLFTELFSVTPVYTTERIHSDTVSKNDCHAVLSIGDEALRLRQQSIFPYVLDLGEAWRKLTGFPFVFAVWAVRKKFYSAHPETCKKIHSSILSSKAYGLAHLAEISAEVHNNADLTVKECREYFNHLKYDLDGSYQKGLKCFFDYLYRVKAVPNPVEIRFID